MTLIFNGQGFSTLPRDQAEVAFRLLTQAMIVANRGAS